MRSSMFTIKAPTNCEQKCVEEYFNNISKVLIEYFPELSQKVDTPFNSSSLRYLVNISITATIRYYSKEDIFAINIDATESYAHYEKKFNNKSMTALKEALENSVQIPNIERIPLIKRNNQVPIYFMSSNERLLEYDFDEIKYHGKSSFQDVKILHSPSLGNTLILDELQNLAEGDLAYTQALMKFGQNSYKDKEILILGGGDGGLLHELLKEDPKEVIMVDIDGDVMRECQKYLKGACGSCLDTFDGKNYKIYVDDCLVWLEKYNKEGRKFDYVFNDLTDIPIGLDSKDVQKADTEEQKESWHFVRKILTLSLPLLGPNGKYLNHAIGIDCRVALSDYEKLLDEYGVKFSRHSAFVPSFMEEWVFYEISLIH